jgi:hypothetical protein
MSAMQTVATKPTTTVSPEVYEYTGKHGIEEPLRRLLEATQRIYPTADSIRVLMRQDVEDQDTWFIVFRVRVPAKDLPDVLAAENLWAEEWMRAYPSPRMHSFVLDLRRQPE